MRSLSPETRKKVLHAALALLTERDFGDITTREISKAASVAEATLFRYFSRKEEILDAILEEVSTEFFGEIENILRLVDDPRMRLLALCRKHAQFAARNRGLVAVLRREMTYNRCTQGTCVDKLRKFLGRVEQVIQDGIAKGVYAPGVDAQSAAMAVHSTVEATLLKERVTGTVLSEDEFIRTTESFLDQLLRGLVADGGKR